MPQNIVFKINLKKKIYCLRITIIVISLLMHVQGEKAVTSSYSDSSYRIYVLVFGNSTDMAESKTSKLVLSDTSDS